LSRAIEFLLQRLYTNYTVLLTKHVVSPTVFADGQAGQAALRLAGLPGLSAKTSYQISRNSTT
jgi:hypothetical protein